MIKQSIRIAGFILALFALILVFKHTHMMQEEKPLGTTERFNLTLLSTDTSKEQLVNELNDLVDQYHAVLVKVVPNQNDYANQRDIIWFGSQVPNGNSPIISDDNISWLEPSVGGMLIHSSDMGVRPLYGSYSMLGSAEFKDALKEWCSQNEVVIDFYKQYPLTTVFLAYFILHGIGNAVLISFFLLLTTIIVWFVTHAKSRALRLLGGISLQRIHFEDTLTIISLAIQGFLMGCAVFLIYLGIVSGINHLSLMLLPTAYTVITFIVVSIAVVLLVSLIVQPKAKHLSFRKIPLKQFRLLGRVSLVLSIILALMVVPTTITMASAYRALSNDYALWESLKDAVSISYNDVDSLYTEDWMPKVESFFVQMEDQDNLCLSMAIDRAILLDKDEMGKYDHIVITDRAWVEATGLDRNLNGDNYLIPINYEDIHAKLREFLSAQLPVWTNAGEAQPEGLGFYEFSGNSFLVLPPNTAFGNSTIQAKNPLVILVEDPVKTLKISSFLLPMSSSGNVVFKNEAILRAALNESPLLEKISHIDSFTEGALQYAQLFKQESFYFAACALCLVSMCVAGVMSAQLWVGENRRRIFTLHTAGSKYGAIIKPALRKEIIIAVCTVLVGGFITYFIRRPELPLLLLSSVILFLLYVLLNYVGYILFSRREFLKMSFRRE